MADHLGVIDILLVEDNPADVRLIREVLGDTKIVNRLHDVCDGDLAIEFLKQRGAYSDSPAIDLVLLDLNLPKKDGRQVLREIKGDPDLQAVPVVVLTTSADEFDIVESYEAHANAYIIKPVKLEQFIHVVQSIEDFWLAIVRLPHE